MTNTNDTTKTIDQIAAEARAASMAQVVDSVHGWTRGELSAALDKVLADPSDWRGKISGVVHRDECQKVGFAIEFFTATKPSFRALKSNPALVRVTAAGYRAGPAF